MRAVRDGVMIEHDDLEELMVQAASLDHEMLLVMRQAIAATIEANPSAFRFTRVPLSGARA
jgi:hypothetical protein